MPRPQCSIRTLLWVTLAVKTPPQAANACQPRSIRPIINSMSRRFQFSLRDLFWLTLVIASIFGGGVIQRQLDERSYRALLATMLGLTLLFGLPAGWRRRHSNPAHLVAICFLCCVFGAGLAVSFLPGYIPR